MAGSRTLKLSILADVDDLKKKLDTGSKEVEGFGGKLEKFGKIAAAAFAAAAAAAAAYAGKLAIEGVKAAIEDEAAQKRLALDISAATGKSVETVSNALAKAYEGNTSSLSRLGVGLSTAEIKTLGLEGTVKQLANTFGGAATVQANTFEGQIQRLRVGFDEAKESVGAALLPTLQRLLDYFINTVIPKFIEFKDAALKPVTDAIARNKDSLTTLYNFIKDFVVPVLINNLGSALSFIGKVAGGVLDVIGFVVNGIKSAVNFAIDAINVLIRAYNAVPLLPNVATISKPSFSAPSTPSSSSLPKVASAPSPSVPSAPRPSATPSAPSASTPSAPSTLVPTGNAIPSNFNVAAVRAGEERGNVVINVNAPSAIDEEGFTRAVILALNNSTNRGTTGAGDLRTSAQIL